MIPDLKAMPAGSAATERESIRISGRGGRLSVSAAPLCCLANQYAELFEQPLREERLRDEAVAARVLGPPVNS